MKVYVAMCNYVATRITPYKSDVRLDDHYIGVYATLEKAIEACKDFMIAVCDEIGYEVDKHHCWIEPATAENVTEVICARCYDRTRRLDCSCEIYHEEVK